MNIIGPLDVVYPSDKLTVTLSYGSLLPEFFLSEAPVREALAPLGHNVLMVDVNTLIGFRKIIIQLHPVQAAEAGVIGKQLEETIRSYFYTVWSVSAEKYEIGGGLPVFSTKTTISLASIAVIGLIGVGLFFYLKGGVR